MVHAASVSIPETKTTKPKTVKPRTAKPKTTKAKATEVVDNTSEVVAEEPKRASKKVPKGGAVAKATKAAKTPKAAKPKAADGEKKGPGRKPDNLLPTMEYFASKGKAGDVRSNARKETGNKNLGLPWLIKHGYIEETVQEESKEHLFAITDAGKKALKAGEFA